MRLFRLLPILLLLLPIRCANPPAPPNLLFIITDDQRFDMMGNMTPYLQTPVMDRLAREGVRFERAFVTTPICAASRATLLSGVVERTHRFTFNTPALDASFTDASYAALLRDAGYRTAHIGKFGVVTAEGATERMFSVFEPLDRNPYFKKQADGTERHLTDIEADRSIAFLESNPAGTPFALTLSFNAPHAEDSDPRQYIWPAAMDTYYTDLEIPTPPLSDPAFLASQPAFLRADTLMNRYRWRWRFDTPEKASAMTKGYFRMISGVDAAMGRVLDALERLGLADNTVVIMMGDNGYFIGERGYAGKWLPHDLSLRVPLLIYDPRTPAAAGRRPEAMALNIDIAPTLLDLAGVPAPASMQGRSLAPFVRGPEPATWRTDFFLEHLMEHPQIVKHEGVRNERFKYARYFQEEPVYEELYDLVADPMETRNLVDDPAFHDTLLTLRSRCDALRDSYGGPYRPHTGEAAMRP
ncbi:MAG: sulfatase [Rhodothermales bacterium]